MGLLDLFVVSTVPVLKLLLVSAVGSFLAFDGVNLLGEEARNHLNNVVFYVFNPALIETNLAQTLTLDSMIKLWFMPLNILITYIIGSAFGWIFIKSVGAPSHLRGLIVGFCSAGNLGNLLLIIIPAVCKEEGSPFGDPDLCHTYGMAYVSLSLSVSSIYIWLYVYNIMWACSSKMTTGVNSIDDNKPSGETSEVFPDCYKEPLLPSKNLSISKKSEDQLRIPCNRSNEDVKVPIFSRLKQHLKVFGERVNLKRLFTASTIGAVVYTYIDGAGMEIYGAIIFIIVGFVVGVVPQIRNLLIGASAPLRVIQDSSSLLGDGAVPVLTLILGGNLVKGFKGPGIKMSVIIWIMVVRYVLLPISGVLIVKTAIHFGLIQSDPLYQFILLLQFAVPPAMSIGVITQLFGEGESECSVIMLWTYILAPVSLTLWSTLFMWLVS